MNNSAQATPRKIGTAMLVIAWGIVLILLSAAFQEWLDEKGNPNQTPDSRVNDLGIKEVELIRNRYNAYVSSGTINGKPVVFIVDTGATDVVVPMRLANKLGLRKGPAATAITANGSVTTYATRLEKLTVGNIQLDNISASINPGMTGNEVLLGMSALKNIEFSQRGNRMILKQFPSP